MTDIQALKQTQDKILDILTEMRDEQNKIRMAVVGDKPLGIEGVVNKVERHEKLLEDWKKTQWTITGIGVAVATFGATIITKIWK